MRKPDYPQLHSERLINIAHKVFLAWKDNQAAKLISIEATRYTAHMSILLYKNLNCRITSIEEKERTSIELIQIYWQMQEHLERIIYIVNECYPYTPKGLKLLSNFKVLRKNIEVWYEHTNIMEIIKRPKTFEDRCASIEGILQVLHDDPLLFIQVSDNNGLLIFWEYIRKAQYRARRRLELGYSSDFYREIGKFISYLYDQFIYACQKHNLCTQTALIKAGFFSD